MTDLRVLPTSVATYAAETPDAPFIVEIGGDTLTYGQAHDRALVWASALRGHGVNAGDTVLSMLPNIPDCICAWLGIGWLRAIEVPVHTAAKGRMLHYFINDSRAKIALVGQRHLSELLSVRDELDHLETIVVVPDGEGLRPTASESTGRLQMVHADEFVTGHTAEPGLSTPHLGDVATILYTSGTTGPSKGVMVPWGQFWQTAQGLDPLGLLGPSDRYYCPHPLFHNGGKSVVAAMGLVGGRIVLRDRFRTSTFWSDVREYGCTSAMLIGSMVAFLESEPAAEDDADSPLALVHAVPLPVNAEEFSGRFGVRLQAWFGMSECGVPIATPDWAARNGDGCGTVRPGFTCRIVDSQDHPVSPGEVGELVIRADEPWMMNLGYWGMPDKTVEAWRNLWLHTGDAVRQDSDGRFHFVDRIKDALRRRGENISSVEVEAEINEHRAVQESAVVGVDSEWGEQEVLAHVVPASGHEVDPEQLHTFLVERMPRFMVPRYIHVTHELPRTPSGKVRKIELRGAIPSGAWDAEATT